MIDLRSFREHPHVLDKALARRGISSLSAQILELDKHHRDSLTKLQALQTKKNTLAKDIGQRKQQKLPVDDLMQEGEKLRLEILKEEKECKHHEEALEAFLSKIPNLPAVDCPNGISEEDNVEVRRWGVPPVFSFDPLPHETLGENLKLMNFDRASRLSGSRFVILYADLARLERALAAFMLDIHTQEFGYTEVYGPLLVHANALFGTGQLPKMQDDLFQVSTGHYLIPTSEVMLTNLKAEEILLEESLPLRYTAYTPCFRAEAGAAGRDTRGMIRQHQFGKVELVSLTKPEDSVQEHERMTQAAETILQRLGLAYRVMNLCGGDLGFSAEKTYDLEVWLPGQKAYREISSCSRCHSFQARRMNTRYRSKDDGKNHFVHTLNGSGVAVGRALIAILENYQQEDGSICIPGALSPYMGGRKKIEPAA